MGLIIFLPKQKSVISGNLIYNIKTKAITYLKWSADRNVSNKKIADSKNTNSLFSTEFRLSQYKNKYRPSFLRYIVEGYLTNEKDNKNQPYSIEGIIGFDTLIENSKNGLENSIDFSEALKNKNLTTKPNTIGDNLSSDEQIFVDEQ